MTICLRCLHEWKARVENPRTCPSCKTHGWETEVDSKCSICKKTYSYIPIHHIDGNDDNNTKENRLPVCQYCHAFIHWGKNLRSKKKRATRVSVPEEIQKKT